MTLIQTVAQDLNYDTEWANDEVTIFLTLLRQPDALFSESKAQSIVLYSDRNLRIYAVLFEWVLVRKLKRLQMEGQRRRPEDWRDCVSITKVLCDRRRGKLPLSFLTRFDQTDREPPVFSKTIDDLRRIVIHAHRFDPFEAAPTQPSTTLSPSQPAQIASGSNILQRPLTQGTTTGAQQPETFFGYRSSTIGNLRYIHCNIFGRPAQLRVKLVPGQRSPQVWHNAYNAWFPTYLLRPGLLAFNHQNQVHVLEH